MTLSVVIPSHARAKLVTTHKAIVVDAICVPEAEKAEYEAAQLGCEIVTHPDSVKGLGAKRQWICDHFGDVFQVDDDIKKFVRKYKPNYKRQTRMTAEDARAAVDALYETAVAVGAYLFTVSPTPDPRHYSPMRPFVTTGAINAAVFGVRAGSKMYCDNKIIGGNEFLLAGLNAYYHRYLWIDTRFAFLQTETYTQPGGLSEYRSEETEQQDTKILKEYFGDAIGPRKGDSRVNKRRPNPFARTLTVPW